MGRTPSGAAASSAASGSIRGSRGALNRRRRRLRRQQQHGEVAVVVVVHGWVRFWARSKADEARVQVRVLGQRQGHQNLRCVDHGGGKLRRSWQLWMQSEREGARLGETVK